MSHFHQTYIIKSGKYYKIGKTKNLKRRLKTFKTSNPDFKVIRLIDYDIEAELHELFEDKWHRLEWYRLDIADIAYIDELMYYKDIMTFSPVVFKVA